MRRQRVELVVGRAPRDELSAANMSIKLMAADSLPGEPRMVKSFCRCVRYPVENCSVKFAITVAAMQKSSGGVFLPYRQHRLAEIFPKDAVGEPGYRHADTIP